MMTTDRIPVDFLLIDWGTSSFRVWAVASDGRVAAERRSSEGMKSCTKADFPRVLEAHLAAMKVPEQVPLMICGMVGAREGWHEAGYLPVPTLLSDIVGSAVSVPFHGRDLRILPGLCQAAGAPNVMRGEETQLLGVATDAEGLACLPGTHSKWVRLGANRIEAFESYMTGEVFSLFVKHSILASSLSPCPPSETPDQDFMEAASTALAKPAQVWRLIFQLRAGDLLSSRDWISARSRLSGLLIGAEVASARDRFGASRVDLVASGPISLLYKAALGAANFNVRLVEAEAATRAGLLQAANQIWPKRVPHSSGAGWSSFNRAVSDLRRPDRQP
jgi:2-dehydro-3-deoxygalactonokinase